MAVDRLVETGAGLAARILPAKAVGAVAKIGFEATDVVGWGQLVYDTATFGIGLAKCW
jgi:hypothetical protein